MMDAIETPSTPESEALKSDVGMAAYNLAQRLQKAWNSKDAAAFASPFGKNADFIHLLGGLGQGRDAIAAGHKRLFETVFKDSKIAYVVERVRLVTDDVALVFMLQGLDFVRDGKPVHLKARPTALLRRVGSAWVVVHFQNTQVQEEAGGVPRVAADRRPAGKKTKTEAEGAATPAS